MQKAYIAIQAFVSPSTLSSSRTIKIAFSSSLTGIRSSSHFVVHLMNALHLLRYSLHSEWRTPLTEPKSSKLISIMSGAINGYTILAR